MSSRMMPSQVRERVLADHAALRALLVEMEDLAGRVQGGDGELLAALRAAGEALLARLLEHMGWEDANLAPALAEADAWGEERVARLDRDHREQRELLAYVLARLRDQSRPPVVLARDLLGLVSLLREDMASEEEALLDGAVLRDDVVSIQVETG